MTSPAGGRYMSYSPSPSSASPSPHLSALRSSPSAVALFEQEKQYCIELVEEIKKIGPFMSVLPHSYRLLTQEIMHVNKVLENASGLGQSGLEHASPLISRGLFPNGGADVKGWASHFQPEGYRLQYIVKNRALKHLVIVISGDFHVTDFPCKNSFLVSGFCHQSSAQNLLSSQGSLSAGNGIVKKTLRVDIPVDQYPSYNFVGRLLGPRGNSLKRVEASTECRVLIRGRGSIKDQTREEMMRGKPGYEHLNEQLHVLIEAELPVDIIDARLMQARGILEELLKPVDESQDFYKKHQLRELAAINGTLRDEGSPMSGSVSPFRNNLGMKRAKTTG